jgi:hypothetical protein
LSSYDRELPTSFLGIESFQGGTNLCLKDLNT